MNQRVFVSWLRVSVCASYTCRVQIGEFVRHRGVKTLDGHERWSCFEFNLTLVGCPTSLNMGHVSGKSGPDAPRSAHWTPNQPGLTRLLAFDSSHANHKHNHNHTHPQANTLVRCCAFQVRCGLIGQLSHDMLASFNGKYMWISYEICVECRCPSSRILLSLSSIRTCHQHNDSTYSHHRRALERDFYYVMPYIWNEKNHGYCTDV